MKKLTSILIIGLIIFFKNEILRFLIKKRYLSVNDASQIVDGISANYNVAIARSTYLAIIETESNFDIEARGTSGEIGLMQLLPTTYRWILDYNHISVAGEGFKAENNILAGMLYFTYCYNQLKDYYAAIHAYNVGVAGYKSGKRNYAYLAKVMSAKIKYDIIA